MRKWVILLLILAINTSLRAQAYIEGVVKNADTQEKIQGASFQILKSKVNGYADEFGRFETGRLALGKHTIVLKSVGFLVNEQPIELKSDTLITFYLQPFNIDLEEVIVTEKYNDPTDLKIGLTTLTKSQIVNIPSIGSEHDVVRILALTPGVKQDNEGNAGLYVRGGSPDQNLVLMDGIPLFKNNNFLGFLSPFSSDILQKVDFYKNAFPARFGGRLSSVLDIHIKPADYTNFRLAGTVGLLSSRFSAEIPLFSNRASLLLAARRSYFDIFTRLFTIGGATSGPFYHFLDLTGKFSLKLNSKNVFQAFAYQNEDVIKGGAENDTEDLQYRQNWNSKIVGVRLNSTFNAKVSNFLELSHTAYSMNLNTSRKQLDEARSMNFSNEISASLLNNTLELALHEKYKLKLGAGFKNYSLRPVNLKFSFNDLTSSVSQDSIRPQEFSGFIENELDAKIVKLNVGIRYAAYKPTVDNAYTFLEPRFSALRTLSDRASIKVAYSRMNQPLHLLFNPGLGLPTDLWFSATKKITPQSSDQFSVAYFQNLKYQLDRTISASVEFYYKKMSHIVSYRDGFSSESFTNLRQNGIRNWEGIVTVGNGKAYGSELMVEKKEGRFTGWAAYTLSWVRHQFDELNDGRPFFARHNRRHDFSIVASYVLNKRWQLNANWIFQTGQAITLPQAAYDYPDYDFLNNRFSKTYTRSLFDYGERNSYRTKATHRLDVSIQRKTTHKWGVGTWEVSVYNLYNRRNPYYYYVSLGETVNSVSLFPIIPSLAYTFNIYTNRRK